MMTEIIHFETCVIPITNIESVEHVHKTIILHLTHPITYTRCCLMCTEKAVLCEAYKNYIQAKNRFDELIAILNRRAPAFFTLVGTHFYTRIKE